MGKNWFWVPIFSEYEFTNPSLSTDLGSLFGNFEYGYFTLWKFINLPTTMILREINFGWFHKVQNYFFNNFEGFEFWCFGNFTLENVKNVQNSNVRAAQMVKMAVFEASQWAKLISGKIWDRKILKFPHLVFPIRLPRSVGSTLCSRNIQNVKLRLNFVELW